VEDLSSKGRRATLTEWLRIGDLLWTRFGICIAKELLPNLGQVKVHFLGQFTDPQECSSRSRHVKYEELRSVLYTSRTPCRCSEGEELKYGKRFEHEELKGDHKKLGNIGNTACPGTKIKYTVNPIISKTDIDISRRDVEEERFLLDSDDIDLQPPTLGRTQRKSVPFQPYTSKGDLDEVDMPMLPIRNASI